MEFLLYQALTNTGILAAEHACNTVLSDDFNACHFFKLLLLLLFIGTAQSLSLTLMEHVMIPKVHAMQIAFKASVVSHHYSLMQIDITPYNLMQLSITKLVSQSRRVI